MSRPLIVLLLTFFIQAAVGESSPKYYPTPPGVKDPLFQVPYVDVDEWRDQPLRHRYVHGGYNGTETRFSFYFPPKESYKGRFFQGLMAFSGRDNIVLEGSALGGIIDDIAPFSFETGGYVVESNQGKMDMFPPLDQKITGFKASAAAAQFGRVVAQEMYGGGRPYGYVFGGSGGGYKTIACAENSDVWDGSAPFIIGSPISIPNVFSVQGHAMRILNGKFEQIVDAIEVGGSGDMYAGLNEEERDALREVTRFGFPPQAWFKEPAIAAGYTGVFSSLMDVLTKTDPSYFTDFWVKPGYLGANPPKSLAEARVLHNTTIKRVIKAKEAVSMGLSTSLSGQFGAGSAEVPQALELEYLPQDKNLQGSRIHIESGEGKGSVVMLTSLEKGFAVIGFGADALSSVGKFKAGDQVTVDNSYYLAAQTYHRHQDPGPEYPVWDQFRVNGKPKYPQRSLQLSQLPLSGTGTLQSGKFKGKMIVIESGWDEAAFPWQADWYRLQVKKSLGPKENDQFRLWMVDKCMHTSAKPPKAGDKRPVEMSKIVSYTPIIQQALRDLVQWVEKGQAPPPSTNYEVVDGQIILPSSAKQRSGIQPVVNLTVQGGSHAEVKVGQAVEFMGTVEIPPGRGKIVDAAFDYEGEGTFGGKANLSLASPYSARVTGTHVFTKTGTYFVALSGIGQNSDNAKSPYGRVKDLGRVRVLVS